MNLNRFYKVIEQLKEAAVDLVYPPLTHCIVCGRKVKHPPKSDMAAGICYSCLVRLIRRVQECPICGGRIIQPAEPGGLVDHACFVKLNADFVHWVREDDCILSDIVRAYIFGGKRYLVDILSFILSETFKKSMHMPYDALVCPADHEDSKRKEAVYALAVRVCERLGFELLNGDIFEIVGKMQVSAKTLIIIDDTYCRGAKSSQMALQLKSHTTSRVGIGAIIASGKEKPRT